MPISIQSIISAPSLSLRAAPARAAAFPGENSTSRVANKLRSDQRKQGSERSELRYGATNIKNSFFLSFSLSSFVIQKSEEEKIK
jgi:hypothetical protein